jgi:hypothetical protein
MCFEFKHGMALFLKYKYVRKETKLDCMIPLLFLLDTNIIYIVANGMVW